MPRSSAAKRTDAKAPAKIVYGLTAQNRRRHELDDLGPIERVTKADIITLRDLCRHETPKKVAESIGVDVGTLMRFMAGFGESSLRRTSEALRAFLTKLNS